MTRNRANEKPLFSAEEIAAASFHDLWNMLCVIDDIRDTSCGPAVSAEYQRRMGEAE